MNKSENLNFDASRAKSMCQGVFDCGIISTQHVGHVLFQAAVTHLLIGLNDLLQKANGIEKRIAITEHVQISQDRKDVTDLVAHCRNAACHIPSGLNDRDGKRFVFNVAGGKKPHLFWIGDGDINTAFGCDFEDDIAVYWGDSRLLLNRNALTAFNAVKAVFP